MRMTAPHTAHAAARLLSGCLCLLMLFPAPIAWSRVDVFTPEARRALDALPADRTLGVIVRLADRADLVGAESVALQLRRHADASQASIRAWLRAQQAAGRVEQVSPLWIVNGLAVTASRDVILELAGRPDVARIALDRVLLAPPVIRPVVETAEVGYNLRVIRAPEAWARGITGHGVVVALLDSGVDMTQPELAARWRGGSNSWFDPYGDFPDAPGDLPGHGTQVLGVILGGDEDGSPLGVAPGAQWIAAKIFDRRGRASVANIHTALQWVLDPDGDPATDDAPHVVNNSWAFVNPECEPEFADDLRALRAAGILPVFAAGVRAPVSPADTPEAFAVGALARDAQTLFQDSPRGPSLCDEALIFPSVVAPGEDIRTTDRFGTFTTLDGTSLAAAHVSGALALLLDANPALTPDEQASLLTETAVDLGEAGPDNAFGYGRIDIAAALDRVLGPDPALRATLEAMTAQPETVDTPAVQPAPDSSAAPLLVIGAACLLVALATGWLVARRRSKQRMHDRSA